MSIRVMTLVWDAFPGGGSDLLALLALADWSDDNGRCYPSISAIAAKTRLSRSQAQRVIHGLIDSGFVQVVGNESGGAPGTTRQYRMVLSHLTGRTGATGSASATGRTDAQDGSHGCAETGRMGATQTVIEPSITVRGISETPKTEKKRKAKSTAISLQTYLNACREAEVKPIPEGDPVFAYAEKVEIPLEFLRLHWLEFKACYSQPDAKQYKDWPAVHRKSVRGNWFRLWLIARDGSVMLTTAGEQARRLHGEAA
ncbi:helix-turn-helix domain-containing protein [Ralstonia pickettii]|uniref:helix-turn-helix domain-containing protein n=1 Tax=Ralstonia pickettii TaxID=329 RepID=UPI000688D873|nr:helix-turn-helix domain-containing protein [Ralstonia pickettii]